MFILIHIYNTYEYNQKVQNLLFSNVFLVLATLYISPKPFIGFSVCTKNKTTNNIQLTDFLRSIYSPKRDKYCSNVITYTISPFTRTCLFCSLQSEAIKSFV